MTAPRLRKVVFINGRARAGKDTVVAKTRTLLQEYGIGTLELSAITPVLKMLTAAGYPVTNKTPKDRDLLAEVGAAVEKYNHTCTSFVIEAARDASIDDARDDIVVFVHCREPERIERIATGLQAEGFVAVRVQVVSQRSEQINSNASDAGTDKLHYHLVIHNNGTLDDLDVGCQDLAAYLRKRPQPHDDNEITDSHYQAELDQPPAE